MTGGPIDRALNYLESVQSAPGTIRERIAECPVARLCAAGNISERMFTAAAKFREAHHNASRGAKMTVGEHWKMRQGWIHASRRAPATETASRHQASYNDMLTALGRHLAVPVLTMALYDRPVVEYGRAVMGYHNTPKATGAGMTALRLGLDVLADHLGLPD